MWATEKGDEGTSLYYRADVSSEYPAGSAWAKVSNNDPAEGTAVRHVTCGYRGYTFATMTNNWLYRL